VNIYQPINQNSSHPLIYLRLWTNIVVGAALVLNKFVELVNVINVLHSSKLIVNIRSINVNNLFLWFVCYATCCLQYNITTTSKGGTNNTTTNKLIISYRWVIQHSIKLQTDKRGFLFFLSFLLSLIYLAPSSEHWSKSVLRFLLGVGISFLLLVFQDLLLIWTSINVSDFLRRLRFYDHFLRNRFGGRSFGHRNSFISNGRRTSHISTCLSLQFQNKNQS